MAEAHLWCQGVEVVTGVYAIQKRIEGGAVIVSEG